MYIPILKDSRRFPEYWNQAMNKLGNMATPEDREMIEEIFETDFVGVAPTQLSVQVPKQVQKQAPVIPQIQAPKVYTPQDLLNMILDKTLHTGRTTMRKLLDEVNITDVNLKRLVDILSLNSDFMDTQVVEIKLWETHKPGKLAKVFVGYENKIDGKLTIGVSSIEKFKESPESIIHEAIHNITLEVFNKEESTLTEAELTFKKEIQAIFAEVKKRKIDLKDLLSSTYSALDEKEFIANLSNPSFYSKLAQEKIKLGDVPKKIKGIWKQIWDATIKFLESDTPEQEISLIDALDASFQNYMISKFKQVDQQTPQVASILQNEKNKIEQRRQEDLKRRTASGFPIKKYNPEGDNTILEGEELEFAETRIERLIQKGIEQGKSSDEIHISVNAGYAFSFGAENTTIKNFIEDRIAGKTTQTFAEFRKDTRKEINEKYDAELVALESQASITAPQLVTPTPIVYAEETREVEELLDQAKILDEESRREIVQEYLDSTNPEYILEMLRSQIIDNTKGGALYQEIVTPLEDTFFKKECK